MEELRLIGEFPNGDLFDFDIELPDREMTLLLWWLGAHEYVESV